MKTEKVAVSYRDKEKNENISLEPIDVQIPETIAEALALFREEGDTDDGKATETLLDYATKAYVIELQRQHRDANRPDKPKSQSNLSKFKQLSIEKQEELLKAAGLIKPATDQSAAA